MSRHCYINQEDLTDARLIDLNARIYDPLIGKFLSPDPVISDQDDSQSWNAYAYSHNNPMSGEDPTGLFMVMGRCLCVGSGGTLAQESDEIMVDNDIINNNDPHIAQMMITAIQLQRSTRTPNSTFESVRLNSVSSALGADVGFLADNSPGRSGTGGTPSGSGTGGDGHPDSDFKRDAKGNLVYSDELSGKYSSCDCLTLTSGYHDARDGTNFHGGIDLAPSRHDADALSVTSGTVVRIGANGFGDSAIIVRTPEGNWATYGHLESTSVRLNDPVNVGDKIGIMGNKGFSHGVHLHFQVTTGQMFGAGSQFLGVTGP